MTEIEQDGDLFRVTLTTDTYRERRFFPTLDAIDAFLKERAQPLIADMLASVLQVARRPA